MSKRKLELIAAAGLALAAVTCASVPMTAPAGTSMFLQCNPPFVVANGGTSLVTALLTEPAGTLVPDGTVVLCLTTLGRIDSEAKTRDGLARFNFVADSRSGQADVSCWSGGAAPAPAPSASVSPSPSPSPAAVASFSASAHRAVSGGPRIVADATSSGTGSAHITIAIGNALPKLVLVTANPAVLKNTRQAAITANVFDGMGNPVQNVPVIFKVEATSGGGATTPALQEFLASGGAPQYTDSSGQAFDTLTTRAEAGTAATKTVTVTAATPVAGVTGDVAVVIYFTPTR